MRNPSSFPIVLAALVLLPACGSTPSAPALTGGVVDTAQSDADGQGGAGTDAAQPDAVQPDSTDAGQPDTAAPPSVCQSDKDCKDAGKVCDPLTKQCVACLSDVECAPSQHCVGYGCQGYTACSNSLGCKSAKGPDGKDQPICDQGIGECSACLSAADCPASHDCKAKQCVPFKTCQNSTDCSKDQVCDKSTNRCVQCLGDNDCSANQLCEQGKCNSFIPCSSDKQCTDKGLLCDQAKGKCTQCLQNSDCPAIYNCQSVGVAKTGVCVLDACAQGQGACSNNQKVTCNPVGDGYGSPQACPSQSTCVAPGGKPECKAWACTPGNSCQGDKAVECSGDGLTALKTSDCAASGQKCIGGSCKTQVCSPGQQYCDGAQVKLCDSDGLGGALKVTCGSSEFCDAGSCKPQICAPNQPACDGNSAAVCNPSGSGYLSGSKDCGQDKCQSGVCKTKVCTPATQFCEVGKLKTCSPDGMSVAAEQPCGTGNYCGLNKSGDAACLAWVCEPGKPTCNGTVATSCKADGSGYEDAGTECKVQGKVCSAGVCKGLLCDPLAPNYCDQNTAMKCDATGLNPSTVQICGSGQYCDKGACQAQVCSPGKPGCFGQIASTCNDNGSGYLAGGADCKAAGKSCSAGGCISSYASCKAALTAIPAATDGLYPIDPDGAGPIAAANLFCDMKNGGLTLVANIYDSAGDDAPNSTDYVVSGWQQTASGKWGAAASKVDRDGSGSGSAAVSLAFVAALKAGAGQQNLKMCFVHQNGSDTTCRQSGDGSMTLVSYATGNPNLTVYKDDKLTYTFGRLAGLAGSVDGYNPAQLQNAQYCVPRTPGELFEFGENDGNYPLALCEHDPSYSWAGVWAGFGKGMFYRPWAVTDDELAIGNTGGGPVVPNPLPTTYGFRLYIGP